MGDTWLECGTVALGLVGIEPRGETSDFVTNLVDLLLLQSAIVFSDQSAMVFLKQSEMARWVHRVCGIEIGIGVRLGLRTGELLTHRNGACRNPADDENCRSDFFHGDDEHISERSFREHENS